MYIIYIYIIYTYMLHIYVAYYIHIYIYIYILKISLFHRPASLLKMPLFHRCFSHILLVKTIHLVKWVNHSLERKGIKNVIKD